MRVVFLDRDGVINEDRPDYVKAWSEFSFIPGSLEALKQLTQRGLRVIVVTNQSIINRNLATRETLEDIFENMKKAVAAYGGRIDAVFYCPHAPENECECRKPEPGLIYRARDAYAIELSETCMIGDSLKDMQCALAAGCGTTILVRTGQGKEAERLCRQKGIEPDYIAENLLEAVAWLLSQSGFS
jgi:D-glycero-D-manno-heptose 1,7-bisphosphate phosphatase